MGVLEELDPPSLWPGLAVVGVGFVSRGDGVRAEMADAAHGGIRMMRPALRRRGIYDI